MGSIIVTNASGTGESSVAGANVTVNEVFAELVTPGGLTHFVGGAGLERVFQAGWFGVGMKISGPYDVRTIVWGKFLQHLAEDHWFDPIFQIFANTLFWDLDPGVVMHLEMWY